MTNTNRSSKKVVNLQERLQAKRQGEGEVTFVLCPCKEDEPESLIPVVLHDAQGAVIVSLVCPECEAEQPVLNGRLVNE